MKKRVTFFLLLCCFGGFQFAQGQTLTLLDTVQFQSVMNSLGQVGGSDVWGYTAPNGDEYAIMGTFEGIAVVAIPSLQIIDMVAGPQGGDGYYHRDIKTYGHYAYAVGEMFGVNQGLIILDMQYLPDSVRFVQAYTDSLQIYSHNISIDTATGYLYVESQGDSGIHVYSLADPEAPVREGFIPTVNTHDMYARNDTVWVAEGYTYAYSVWDLTNKANPQIMTRITDPGFGYAHQIWPSEDGKYFYTTEETDFKTVKCWEWQSNTNVVRRGQYLGPCDLAHNVHVEDGIVWISHYESGVRAIEWSDPDNPIEVAFYDTYTASENPDFFGCWGVYPHNDGNYIYASNLDGKLTIMTWEPPVSVFKPVQPVKTLNYGPNPFVNRTVVNAPDEIGKFHQVIVYDISGKVLLFSKNPFGEGNWEWNGADAAGKQVSPGTYFMYFSGKNAEEVIRIIKQ